jgi:hypothetical protein
VLAEKQSRQGKVHFNLKAMSELLSSILKPPASKEFKVEKVAETGDEVVEEKPTMVTPITEELKAPVILSVLVMVGRREHAPTKSIKAEHERLVTIK